MAALRGLSPVAGMTLLLVCGPVAEPKRRAPAMDHSGPGTAALTSFLACTAEVYSMVAAFSSEDSLRSPTDAALRPSTIRSTQSAECVVAHGCGRFMATRHSPTVGR